MKKAVKFIYLFIYIFNYTIVLHALGSRKHINLVCPEHAQPLYTLVPNIQQHQQPKKLQQWPPSPIFYLQLLIAKEKQKEFRENQNLRNQAYEGFFQDNKSKYLRKSKYGTLVRRKPGKSIQPNPTLTQIDIFLLSIKICQKGLWNQIQELKLWLLTYIFSSSYIQCLKY